MKKFEKACYNCRFSIPAGGHKNGLFDENCLKVYCRWHAEKKHEDAVCQDWKAKDNIFTIAEIIDAIANKESVEDRTLLLECKVEIPKEMVIE